MPFDGGHSKPKFRTLPHDWLDRELLRRHEHNYASGASALVQQEIAGIAQSIYHKPSAHLDWSVRHIGRVLSPRAQMGDFLDDDPADWPRDPIDLPDLTGTVLTTTGPTEVAETERNARRWEPAPQKPKGFI